MGEVELLKEQIRMMAERMAYLEQSLHSQQKSLIKEALREFTAQKKDPLKDEIMRKFSRSRRELVKQKIVELLMTKPMKLSDLKYNMVEQMKYCSKASFYRYVEELYGRVEVQEGVIYLVKNVTA